jgi:hypothetical protein
LVGVGGVGLTSTNPTSQKLANDDQLRTVCGPVHAVKNTVRAAEPKLTFTSGAEQDRDAGDELVRLAIKALCP